MACFQQSVVNFSAPKPHYLNLFSCAMLCIIQFKMPHTQNTSIIQIQRMVNNLYPIEFIYAQSVEISSITSALCIFFAFWSKISKILLLLMLLIKQSFRNASVHYNQMFIALVGNIYMGLSKFQQFELLIHIPHSFCHSIFHRLQNF